MSELFSTWERQIGTIPFTADSQGSLDLPKDRDLLEIHLNFEGTLSVTIPTGGAATVAADAPFTLLRAITHQVGGRATWNGITGDDLRDANMVRYYTAPPSSIAVAAGNNPVAFDLFLPMTYAEDNALGAIPTYLLSNHKLLVTWGDVTNLVALSGGATATLTGTLTVYVQEADVSPGHLSPALASPRYFAHDTITKSLTQAGDNALDMSRGAEFTYLAWQTAILQNGALDNGTLLSALRVAEPEHTKKSYSAAGLRAKMQRYYRQQLRAGVYWMDFDFPRNLLDPLVTATAAGLPMTTVQYILTTTAVPNNGEARIVAHRMVPQPAPFEW